jgi:Rrf2 family protein
MYLLMSKVIEPTAADGGYPAAPGSGRRPGGARVAFAPVYQEAKESTMRISVKGRYALAAVTVIAQRAQSRENVTVSSISEELGISKIYLEQVFSQLKKEGLLLSVKGPRGGYQLSRALSKITVWEVLTTLEAGLTERTENTVGDSSPEIELALQSMVFEPLDAALKAALDKITVQDLLDYSDKQKAQQAFMLNL